MTISTLDRSVSEALRTIAINGAFHSSRALSKWLRRGATLTSTGFDRVALSDAFTVVGEAADGSEARQLYGELKPDVVTMDIVMPSHGGIDALPDIREADPNAKVVMITAIDQRERLMEAMKLGAVDYVVKPFEKDRVKEAMSRVLTA